MAVLDLEREKENDVSKGENLTEAPKDERSDTLPNYLYREELAILIEPTVPINIGIEESQ